jgi:predicted Zn finger-like uncharacterized protein
MILTCPACDTKYVVKNDAIPPGGRQVRCASCKHSWHQDPEPAVAEPASDADFDAGGAQPPPEAFDAPLAEVPLQAGADDFITGQLQPEPADNGHSPWGPVTDEPPVFAPGPDETAMEEAPAIADDLREPAPAETPDPAPPEQEFAGYAPIADNYEEPKRRWPLILAILLLIAAAAAAFWYLAPPEWKARAGLPGAGATQLELMVTTKERQRLEESGNELVLLSGRIINRTAEDQRVPPIQVQLRDAQSNAVVNRWTIAPPRNVLGPGESVNFNSAQVDERRDGTQLLDLTFGVGALSY